MNNIATFFKVHGLMPHGYCLVWNPLLLVTHITADTLIFSAYMIIPMVILYVKTKRKDYGFSILYTLFFFFILLCGITHLSSLIVLWYPAYGVEGILKLLTGLASMTTAIYLVKHKGELIEIASPEALKLKNKELSSLYHQLSSVNEQLESKIEQRVIELKKVNDELLAFSYIVSHDFREPLRTIRQFSEIIKDDYLAALPDEGKQFVEIIYSASLKSSELLDSLTKFSTIGKGKGQKTSVDINQVVNSTVETLKDKAATHQVNVEITDKLPTITAVHAHMSQLFANLIDNAIKYADPNQSHKFIRIGYSEKSHRITLVDNGLGIPQDRLEECKNVFYKINKRSEGLGMGLSICKKLCLINNIDLELSNNDFGGLTVTLKVADDIGESGAL